MASSSDKARVAIIAVHGVADQKPGETARALADLLIVSSAGAAAPGARYRLEGAGELGLQVTALPSSEPARRALPAGPRGAAASLPARLAKAWRQSLGSDLHRQSPATQVKGAPALPEQPQLSDADVELTDFLLAESVRNEMPAAVYDTDRLTLQRDDGGAGQPVHVYEMYWADLSRLAGNVPRILTELFTLIFRLSQLGRDTVAAAARQFKRPGGPSRRWHGLDLTQAALDWLFSRVLAQLMLQLLIVVAIMVPLGAVLKVEGLAGQIQQVLRFLLPMLLLFYGLYRRDRSTPVLAMAAAGLAWLLFALAASWAVALVWLALLALFTDWLLGICDARFPMTQLAGRVIGAVVLATVLGSALWFVPEPPAAAMAHADLTPFVLGALRAMEFLLLAVVVCWILIGLLLVAWLVLGYLCARGYPARATVATGRLGLFVSMAFFLTLVMASWALLEPLLLSSVADLRYAPAIFSPDHQAGLTMAAECFLEERYKNTTETFSIVVLLVLLILLYLVGGMLPAVLAELKVVTEDGLPLGRWLTRTYRYLDLVLAGLVTLSVAFAAMVVINLALSRLHVDPLPDLRMALDEIQRWSQDFLGPLTLVVAAASATATLMVLGGLLSRYVPGLRAPLDVALDVDNHFREFPRRGIPRSRIFSRYAALLRHLSDQGYERIVIVAHSQGTVLSAEFLRYLKARAGHEGDVGEAALLGRDLAGRVHLLTAGCPLRQLYASRFPVLYPWVLRQQQLAGRTAVGPTAQGIGVQRWINAYTTGDYVGRWLWSREPLPASDTSATIIDALARPCDVYEPALDNTAWRARATREPQLDVCLGAGAHTHYFEPDQAMVAALVDSLVASPWPPLPQQAEGLT